jgi:hypothetical protein
MSNDDKEKLFNLYETNKNLIESREYFESWRKLKYDKRCYPFKHLVGNLLEKK